MGLYSSWGSIVLISVFDWACIRFQRGGALFKSGLLYARIWYSVSVFAFVYFSYLFQIAKKDKCQKLALNIGNHLVTHCTLRVHNPLIQCYSVIICIHFYLQFILETKTAVIFLYQHEL